MGMEDNQTTYKESAFTLRSKVRRQSDAMFSFKEQECQVTSVIPKYSNICILVRSFIKCLNTIHFQVSKNN